MNEFLKSSAEKSALKAKVENFISENPKFSKNLEDSDKILKGVELEDAEDELIVLMHHRFLAGMDDEYIDYSKIDFNE